MVLHAHLSRISVLALAGSLGCCLHAQQQAPGTRDAARQAAADGAAMAHTVEALWPAGVISTQAHPGQWAYEVGTLLDGMTAQWQLTHDPRELAYIRATVDRWIDPNGHIDTLPNHSFDPDQHTLDNLEPGRVVLFCYQTTHDRRYREAARYLFAQFATQPRNSYGGFWHKQVYPQQMWLDGAYMAEPFRAGYAEDFGPPAEFEDIANQLLLMYEHMRDPQTGLLRHGWDAARQQPWANKQTGLSPESWARAMGWYAMALVDTLPRFPQNHPARQRLIDVLGQVAGTVTRYQDPATGLWWDVLDKADRPGNFREASASAMFVYALAKGVRLGYLPPRFRPIALHGWQGIESTFLSRDAEGALTLHGTVKVSGLGGTPYRAGDYNYYVHEPVVDNDPKGVGAYLLAASEIAQTGRKGTP